MSPEGTAEMSADETPNFQPSLRDGDGWTIGPSVETLGYSHRSLRDGLAARSASPWQANGPLLSRQNTGILLLIRESGEGAAGMEKENLFAETLRRLAQLGEPEVKAQIVVTGNAEPIAHVAVEDLKRAITGRKIEFPRGLFDELADALVEVFGGVANVHGKEPAWIEAVKFVAKVESGVRAARAFGEEERVGCVGAGAGLFPCEKHLLDGAHVAEGAASHAPAFGDDTGLLAPTRSEEHTSELQSHHDLVCRLLLEK